MSERTSRNGIVLLLLVIAAAVFGAGINWGLPSRAGDKFLYSQDRTGLRLEPLTAKVPEVDNSRGADVVSARGDARAIVPLNDTDTKRAQILCRYRLYSEQPDEMITFRALSRMKPTPSGMDPRLYQYGGLWIYSIAAIVQAGSALGMLDLANRSLYIGNPAEFGKFYVAARGFSAVWGLIGVIVVFALIRRLSVSRRNPGKLPLLLPAAGALCFILMPVVITMAHEAKPHLPEVVLILMAILTASYYIETGLRKWVILTGLLCGAAAGMVLWGIIALIILPVMVLSRREAFGIRGKFLLISIVAAVGVYCVSNPFVIYHLFVEPAVLTSNLANTSAMYHFGRIEEGAWVALQLVAAGASPLILVAGVIGTFVLAATGCCCRSKPTDVPAAPDAATPDLPPASSTHGIGILLFVISIVALVGFVSTAAGKPGEYGRFALLPDIALAIAATAALGRMRINGRVKAGSAVVLIAATALYGSFYVIGFLRDSLPGRQTTRQVEAQELQKILEAKNADHARHFVGSRPSTMPAYRPTLGVFADAAPYDLPPVDLTGWDILRLPHGYERSTAADVIIRPDESISWLDPTHTTISWADKKFVVVQPRH